MSEDDTLKPVLFDAYLGPTTTPVSKPAPTTHLVFKSD